MKALTRRYPLLTAILLLAVTSSLAPMWMSAQAPWPFTPARTPEAQRNTLREVQSRVNWLQNTTKTAPNYGAGGRELLWQQFQSVCGAYEVFKSTLNPQQLHYGANDLAELDAGLQIIQQAFVEYDQDLSTRRSPLQSLRGLCRVLSEASALWLRELNQDSARLRVGRI
jgi:hypothetical protein